MNNSIVAFLLGKKGLVVLKQLINQNYIEQIEKVIIGRDTNVSNDYSNEIKQLCEGNNISHAYSNDSTTKSTYWIAIGWRHLINAPNTIKLIVIHDSLLPKYRGFSPLVSQLINGEKIIGASCILANEKFDEGDIIFQDSFEVNYPIKIEKAIDLMGTLYADLISKLMKVVTDGKTLKTLPQDHSLATYSVWRDEMDYYIDWTEHAERIERMVNAVGSPYAGAHAQLNDELIVIEEVEAIEDVNIENRAVGKVLMLDDNCPIVICGTGLLKIKVAFYTETRASILPLKKFRSRFN